MRLARKLSSQSCGFALEALRVLSRGVADQVVRHVLERGEIGGRVFGSHAAFVVAEHHVHDPMQAVFDRPMIADHRPDEFRRQDQRSDVEARFALCLSVDFARAFDHDDALQDPAIHGALAAMRHRGSPCSLRVSMRP